MAKYYKLKDFSPQDIEKAKSYLKKAFVGFLHVCADEKINGLLDELKNIPFRGNDSFNIDFTMNTLGNDILAAIGCAELERGENGDTD